MSIHAYSAGWRVACDRPGCWAHMHISVGDTGKRRHGGTIPPFVATAIERAGWIDSRTCDSPDHPHPAEQQ